MEASRSPQWGPELRQGAQEMPPEVQVVTSDLRHEESKSPRPGDRVYPGREEDGLC